MFGANLYNQYLSQRKASGRMAQVARTRTIEHLLQADPSDWAMGAESCCSILVEVFPSFTLIYYRNLFPDVCIVIND